MFLWMVCILVIFIYQPSSAQRHPSSIYTILPTALCINCVQYIGPTTHAFRYLIYFLSNLSRLSIVHVTGDDNAWLAKDLMHVFKRTYLQMSRHKWQYYR